MTASAHDRLPRTAGTRWHLVSCGYPPAVGGVASYTRALAEGLAGRGADVHVWCGGDGNHSAGPVQVHASPDRWSVGDLARVGRELDRSPAPRTLFVQWVPHGYGYRSLNLPFAAWVFNRARVHRDEVELMVHEPWLAYAGASPRVAAAATVHRVMMLLLLRAARRAWVSIPAWQPALRRLAGRTEVGWLPVPALLPVTTDPAGVQAVRAVLGGGSARLVGHFGTYGSLITDLLEPSVDALLEAEPEVRVVLLGQGSDRWRAEFAARHPRWAARVVGAGTLDERQLSLHLQACDVMLQPYPDGVSARRTTATSLLAHGCAVVTTRGPLTEALWRESGGVEAVVPRGGDLAVAVVRLLGDEPARERLARAARELHGRVFGLDHTLAVLLGVETREPAVA